MTITHGTASAADTSVSSLRDSRQRRTKHEVGLSGRFRVFRVGDDPALLELPPGRRRLAHG